MLETIIANHSRKKESLIPILQAIQQEYRYLPQDVLCELCRETDNT